MQGEQVANQHRPFGGQESKFLSVILAAMLAGMTTTVRAGEWTCPNPGCGITIRADPRDPGYLQRLIQVHQGNCPRRNAGNSSGSSVNSGPSAWEMEQQRRAEEERQRKLREAEEQRRAQEAAERAFRADKQRALAELKRSAGDNIEVKTGTKFFAGDVKDNRTSLGIKEALRAPLKSDPNLRPVPARLAAQWLHTGGALYLSAKAARATTASEAAYLASQAALAMNGERLGVQLPDRWRLRDAIPEPVQQAYQGIISSTSHEMKRASAARQQIVDLLAQKQALQPKLIAAKKDLATSPREQIQNSNPPPVAQTTTQNPPSATPASADADAEAALAAALAASAAADAALDTARAQLAQAEAALVRNNAFAEQLDANADAKLASTILQQLRNPAPTAPVAAEPVKGNP